MLQIGLIGIGAGAAAALMIASLTTGAIVSIILCFLAPLPILIAALGWGHWAGLVAVATSAISLGVAFSGLLAITFLAGIGLPAWWLGYLALLARPAPPPSPDGLEWYPVGRLAIWTAVLGALVASIAIPMYGTDPDSFYAALKSSIERFFRLQSGASESGPLKLPGLPDLDQQIEFLALIALPATAIATTLMLAGNLWLAARIVKISGLLKRPWPDLGAMRFPAAAPGLTAAAIAGTFLTGLAGIVAGVFTASFLIAYAMLGLAVLHALTRRVHSRGILLAGIYAAVFVFGWPVLVVSLLGLIDTALDLRSRVPTSRGPPAAPRS